MTTATAQLRHLDARHLDLVRLEQAAGQAFGCADESDTPSAPSTFLTPTTITLATFATAVAATLTYLV